jgi:hypothetical protein
MMIMMMMEKTRVMAVALKSSSRSILQPYGRIGLPCEVPGMGVGGQLAVNEAIRRNTALVYVSAIPTLKDPDRT